MHRGPEFAVRGTIDRLRSGRRPLRRIDPRQKLLRLVAARVELACGPAFLACLIELPLREEDEGEITVGVPFLQSGLAEQLKRFRITFLLAECQREVAAGQGQAGVELKGDPVL